MRKGNNKIKRYKWWFIEKSGNNKTKRIKDRVKKAKENKIRKKKAQKVNKKFGSKKIKKIKKPRNQNKNQWNHDKANSNNISQLKENYHLTINNFGQSISFNN